MVMVNFVRITSITKKAILINKVSLVQNYNILIQENEEQKQMLRSSETLSTESFTLLEKHCMIDFFP